MEYFNNTVLGICNNIHMTTGLKTGFIAKDKCNVRFCTDTRISRNIKLYQICDQSDLDKCLDMIRYDLTSPVHTQNR